MNRGRASRQIFAGKKKNTRNRDRAHVKSRDNKHLRSVRGLTSSVNLMKFSLSLSLSLSLVLSQPRYFSSNAPRREITHGRGPARDLQTKRWKIESRASDYGCFLQNSAKPDSFFPSASMISRILLECISVFSQLIFPIEKCFPIFHNHMRLFRFI